MFGNLRPHTRVEAANMDSATETVCRRKPALAAKVEAALTEPTEAEEEDAPAQEADMGAVRLVGRKWRLITCKVARGNYLTFLGRRGTYKGLCTMKEASNMLPKDTAAADHDQKKLVRECGPGNAIPDVPRLRSTRLK